MTALLPALLAGLGLAVLVRSPTASTRLRSLTPEERPAPGQGVSPLVMRAVSLVGGLGAALVLKGLLGAAVGVAIAVAGPALLGRLDSAEDDSARLAAQLPLALDLLGACLAGGSTLQDGIAAVAAAMPGPVGDRLLRVHAAVAVGSSPGDAFAALGTDGGPAGAAARALSRSADGGAPVALAVAQVAADARRAATLAARSRARRAGVQVTGPLAACFLPAFVLLGVVPTVVGLATPVLRGL